MGTRCQRTRIGTAVTGIQNDRLAKQRLIGGHIGRHRLTQRNDHASVLIKHTEAVEAITFMQGKGIDGICSLILPVIDELHVRENGIFRKRCADSIGMTAVQRHTECHILLDAVDGYIVQRRNANEHLISTSLR